MSRGGRLWQLRSGVAGLRGRMRDAFGTSPGRHRRPHGSFRSWPRLWFRRPAVGRRPDAFTRFVPCPTSRRTSFQFTGAACGQRNALGRQMIPSADAFRGTPEGPSGAFWGDRAKRGSKGPEERQRRRVRTGGGACDDTRTKAVGCADYLASERSGEVERSEIPKGQGTSPPYALFAAPLRPEPWRRTSGLVCTFLRGNSLSQHPLSQVYIVGTRLHHWD